MTELDSILLLIAAICSFFDARISWVLIGLIGLLHLLPLVR